MRGRTKSAPARRWTLGAAGRLWLGATVAAYLVLLGVGRLIPHLPPGASPAVREAALQRAGKVPASPLAHLTR